MKVTKDFFLTEFVSKRIWDAFGEKSIWFIDPKIITLAQFVRDTFNKPITINNWWDNIDGKNQIAQADERQYSGFREPKCTIGGELSQHRHGRAIDIKVSGLSPQEIYDYILKNSDVFRAVGLTTLEDIRDTPTWNHLDVRNTGKGEILIVRP
jgi:hypothetical protein